jgi:hypothetical protein
MSIESTLERIAAALESIATAKSTTLTAPVAESIPATELPPPKAVRKKAAPAAIAPAVTSEAVTAPVTASAPTAAAAPTATPSALPTDSDVRTALVQAQTRLGGREKPQAVLAKYANPATIAGLPKDMYVHVIAECAALQ